MRREISKFNFKIFFFAIYFIFLILDFNLLTMDDAYMIYKGMTLLEQDMCLYFNMDV